MNYARLCLFSTQLFINYITVNFESLFVQGFSDEHSPIWDQRSRGGFCKASHILEYSFCYALHHHYSYFRMKSDSHWEHQRDVLWKHIPLIAQSLDITAILPYLMSKGLVTDNDLDILRNEVRTRSDKILHLVDVLPRKPEFFERFLSCLYRSATGTAHAEIAQQLMS